MTGVRGDIEQVISGMMNFIKGGVKGAARSRKRVGSPSLMGWSGRDCLGNFPDGGTVGRDLKNKADNKPNKDLGKLLQAEGMVYV